MLTVICLLFVGCAGTVCFYHIALGLVGLCCRRSAPKSTAATKHRFAILIPAHNEQAVLETGLRSCASLDYPSDGFRVFVIADNCSDRTAEIATSFGAECLERYDAEKKGKGHALQWAFPQILRQRYDALIVLDADCQLNAAALRSFDWYLSHGHRVLQANDVVANPDESPLSYLLALANVLENELFYLPKSVLGLAVFLRGTGMVFHRDVLSEIPWDASSPVEDTEYTCRLLQRGIRVEFAYDARVSSDFPHTQDELAVQRERWIGGGVRFAKKLGAKLILSGLVRANLALIDAGWTTYITSRPLVLIQLATSGFLCLLNLALFPSFWSLTLLGCCGIVVAFYALYVVAGIFLLGISIHRVRLLVSSPLLISKYLELALRTLISGRGRNLATSITPRNDRTLG